MYCLATVRNRAHQGDFHRVLNLLHLRNPVGEPFFDDPADLFGDPRRIGGIAFARCGHRL